GLLCCWASQFASIRGEVVLAVAVVASHINAVRPANRPENRPEKRLAKTVRKSFILVSIIRMAAAHLPSEFIK
ncbi:hypothetical protein N8979_01500, partial [bacterium]|nr:hypothetical protein [bacterium]